MHKLAMDFAIILVLLQKRIQRLLFIYYWKRCNTTDWYDEMQRKIWHV